MSKLIAVYGKPGSGTTTTAVNLAVALGIMNQRVCVISSELDCGELQTFFGETVGPDKGFERAKDSTTGLFRDKVVNTKYKGVDIIPVPDDGAEKLGEILMSEQLDELLETMSLSYGFIIADCAAGTYNPFTTHIGLFKDTGMFLCVHKPSLNSVLWYNAHSRLFSSFDKRPVHIINNISSAVRPEDYAKMIPGFSPSFQLPYVSDAQELENTGVPIMAIKKPKEKSVRAYQKEIREIAEFVGNNAGKSAYTRTDGKKKAPANSFIDSEVKGGEGANGPDYD